MDPLKPLNTPTPDDDPDTLQSLRYVTGRLSSSTPNLQNIPIPMSQESKDLVNQIKKALSPQPVSQPQTIGGPTDTGIPSQARAMGQLCPHGYLHLLDCPTCKGLHIRA